MLNRILDASIVLSFDKNGFVRHAKDFNERDMAVSLEGQHIVITGANSGIGYAATASLLKMGAKVTLVGRNRERAETAAQALLKDEVEAKLEVKIADMSSLASVRSLAEELDGSISCLIHNAGAMLPSLTHTEDGHETITATHILGPYLLTAELRKQGKLECSMESPSRVIFVSSGGMYSQALSVSRLAKPPLPYDGMVHYAQTKRAQVVLSEILDKRLKSEGVRCVSMHPGWVDTPGVRTAMPKFFRVTKKILRNTDEGADTIVWLACVDNEKLDKRNVFYFDRKSTSVHKMRKTRKGDSQDELLEYVEKASGCRLA